MSTDLYRATQILENPTVSVRPVHEGTQVEPRKVARFIKEAALCTSLVVVVGGGLMLAAFTVAKDAEARWQQQLSTNMQAIESGQDLASGLDLPNASRRLEMAQALTDELAKQGGAAGKLAAVCQAMSVRLPEDTDYQFRLMVDWSAQHCGINLTAQASQAAPRRKLSM